jgi:hypothetical protein
MIATTFHGVVDHASPLRAAVERLSKESADELWRRWDEFVARTELAVSPFDDLLSIIKALRQEGHNIAHSTAVVLDRDAPSIEAVFSGDADGHPAVRRLFAAIGYYPRT